MRTSCHYQTVLSRQLEVQEVAARWQPACVNVSPRAEEHPLLEVVNKVAQ
jgi:hypothetical protein